MSRLLQELPRAPLPPAAPPPPTDEVETDEVETTADTEVPDIVEPTLPDSSPEVADTLAKASAAIAGEQPQDEVTPEEPTDETDQGTE